MTRTAGQIATDYHKAWTTGNFKVAIDLLSPDLRVEVPINEYPTMEDFAAALQSFGSMAESVELVSTLSSDHEAMVLYDMEVPSIGTMRIADHFTIEADKIVVLRQIHDTAALRGGQFDSTLQGAPFEATSYYGSTIVTAPPSQVYSALATKRGIKGWWTSKITGNPEEGSFTVGFVGLTEQIEFSVESMKADECVIWTCRRHSGHPEWVGTRVAFRLSPIREEGTHLAVQHIGLISSLVCYGQCEAGWDHFLESIRLYVETGKGMPFDQR